MAAHLLKEQAQRAFRLPAELAQAVRPFAREEGPRLGRLPRACTCQRSCGQRLACPWLPVEVMPLQVCNKFGSQEGGSVPVGSHTASPYAPDTVYGAYSPTTAAPVTHTHLQASHGVSVV